MKLNKGDRIKYNDSIYAVAAVIMSTVYLRAENNAVDFMYTEKELRDHYRDFEIIKWGVRVWKRTIQIS